MSESAVLEIEEAKEAEAQPADDVAPDADAKEAKAAKAAERYEASLRKLANAIGSTIDYKGKLHEYYDIGRDLVSLARVQAKSVAKYETKDWNRMCERVTDMVVMSRKGINTREVRVKDYAMVYFWVEDIRPRLETLNPEIAKRLWEVPYGVVANYLVTGGRITFEVGKVSGEINDKWVAWMVEAVPRILSDAPFDVAAEIAAKKEAIAKEALAKLDPEEAAKREADALIAKAKAERSRARTGVMNAVHDALKAGLKPSDIGFAANVAFDDAKVEDRTGFGHTETKEVPPNFRTLTPEQAREFVLGLLAHQNVKAIVALEKACKEVLAPMREQMKEVRAAQIESNPTPSVAAEVVAA